MDKEALSKASLKKKPSIKSQFLLKVNKKIIIKDIIK